MRHKCFISYKKEDLEYKNEIVRMLGGDCYIDKTLNDVIQSADADYICQKIREEHLRDSTVTLFLIGAHSRENDGKDERGRDKNFFIKWELQASLFNGVHNTRNGILGIVLPEMVKKVFHGKYECGICHGWHNYVRIDDGTVVREFSCNYYIKPNDKCAWWPEDRYCVLTDWDSFMKEPDQYINEAYAKRSAPIAQKVKIRNLR